MENDFVVEVLDTPQDAVALAKKIAPIFRLREEQAMGLIRRMPGVVTKPASEQNSKLIASRLQQAGVNARVRSLSGASGTSAATPASPKPSPTPPPASAAARAPQTPPTTAQPASRPPAQRPTQTPSVPTPAMPTPESRGQPEPSTTGGGDAARPNAERATRPTTPPPTASPREAPARPAQPTQASRPVQAPAEMPPSAAPSQRQRPEAAARIDSEGVRNSGIEEISPEEITARLTAAQQRQSTSKTGSDSVPSQEVKQQTEAINVDVRQSAISEPSERPRRAAATKRVRRRRGSLRRKLLWAAIIPTLISLVGALAIVWFIARPALYEQLLASAQNPAVATAAGISASLEERAAGQGDVDVLNLLDTILVTKEAFGRGNISFIVATDTQGNPFSSYFADASSFTVGRGVLENLIRQQATNAISTPNITVENETLTTNDATLQIVAQPLIANNSAFGAIVVGVTDRAVSRQVNQIFITMGALSLALLLLALLIAQGVSRPLTRNVLSLTQAADQISRGDLDTSITTKSNDELDDLSAALERLRVSMKEAIERLRRRRG